MAPTHNINSPNGEVSEQAIQMLHSMGGNNIDIGREVECGKVKSTNTLQSVLRGEVPSAYMHLAVPSNTCYYRNSERMSGGSLVIRHANKCENGYRPYTCSSPNRPSQAVLQRNHVTEMNSASPTGRYDISPVSDRHTTASIYGSGSSNYQEIDSYNERSSPVLEGRYSPFQDSGSPFIGHHSSPYYHANSPTNSGYGSGADSGSSYTYHRHTMSPYSPYHRAAATPSPHSSTSSPYSGSHPVEMDSPPALYSKESSFTSLPSVTSNDQPIDLSKKPDRQSAHTCVQGESDNSNGSLLRNLLTPGTGGFGQNVREGSGRDTPDSVCIKPEIPITGSTRVTLAKKMVYPITSRVSDWLLKIVQFSKSIPEFASMSQNDKLTLIINAWTRMLLLLMAENDAVFAVTPLTTETRSKDVSKPTQEEPTMKSVEGVQNFMKKCKNLSLDQKEYALIRMAVLFNTGIAGLDDPVLVERLNSAVQQLLQQHVTATRPDDVMHYSKILMLFPALYGINCKMVENLFCKRINTDMEVLLKEMLQNV